MGFEYDKLKRKKEDGSYWASYSDLYTMLSVVFLFLYVSVSMRSTTQQFFKTQEAKKLSEQNQDLQQQIQVYNALRDNHLQHGATEREKQVYQNLMTKLDLLQDEARQEKEDLRKQAKENEQKEYALNEYQRMIRNILTTNLLAKTQIQRRDLLIDRKNENIRDQAVTIATQDSEIKAKEAVIQEKQEQIAANRQRIKRINQELANKIEAIKEKQEQHKITKAQLNKQIAKLKQESLKRIKSLENQTNETQRELTTAQKELQQAVTQLASTEQELQSTEQELQTTRQQSEMEKAALQAQAEAEKAAMQAQAEAEKQQLAAKLAAEKQQLSAKAAAEKAAMQAQAEAERKRMEAELQGEKAKYAGEMEQLKADHEAKAKAERDAFNDALAKAQVSAGEKAKRLAEFEKQAKQREQELQGKLGDLSNKIGETQEQLAKAESEKGRALASLEGVKKEREQLQGDLKRANELANARRELANKIQAELKKAGLKGTVDGKTGDVTLSFGEEYFDTGSAQLKPTMTKTLEKFMPGYSKSLFTDPKIAQNIENVEIIGFASSTYKGRYVPPGSLRPEDQEAVKYNLNLSFNRAKSIFGHIFDTNKMSFDHQKQLLPKMKVVGRGYLPDGKTPQDFPPGMKESEFCKKFNCKQAQKVIIKFNLKP